MGFDGVEGDGEDIIGTSYNYFSFLDARSLSSSSSSFFFIF